MAETRDGADRPVASRDNLRLAPDPSDVAAVCCLVLFVIATTVGGFLFGTAIGFCCLAGASLVTALILGLDNGSDTDARLTDIEAWINAQARKRT